MHQAFGGIDSARLIHGGRDQQWPARLVALGREQPTCQVPRFFNS